MLPQRKHPRLKNYDYAQTGCYHITICTKNHKPILSTILPPQNPTARAQVHLRPPGAIANKYIYNIPSVYTGVRLDKYVIMPNHIHLLLFLEPEASVSISTIVRSLKRMTCKEFGSSFWQDSFYDVVIRNDTMYRCEWEYIDENPDKWAEDQLYTPAE